MAMPAAATSRGQSLAPLRAGVALVAAAAALAGGSARAAETAPACLPEPKDFRTYEEVDALDAALEACLARLDPLPVDGATERGRRGALWLVLGGSAALTLGAGGALAARRGVTFRR